MKSPEKQDNVSACLNIYLKRRGYLDDMATTQKKAQKFVCTKDDLLLNSMVTTNVGESNSIALSSLSSDPTVLLLQYNRFNDYILNNKTESEIMELDGLLLPILLHTFADLVSNGYRTSAHEFLKQRCNLLPKKELSKALLSSDEKVLSTFLKEIKSKKFKFSLPHTALQNLLYFLKEQDNLYVLHLLNRYVEFTIFHEGEQSVLPEGESAMPMEILRTFTDLNSKQSLVESLLRITSKLKHSSYPMLPSVHLLDFSNSQGMSCSTLSPDEICIASGNEDSDIFICPLQSHLSDPNGSLLKGHFKSVSSIDFFSDSRWLISGSYDKTIRLWDTLSKKTVVMYRGHTYHVNGLATCSIGHMFASCSYDQTVKLWSTDRVFPLRNFLGHMQSVNCISCHPNSNYMATGSSDMTVRLWSVQDGRSVRLMLGHQGRVDALAFSPDGKFLASAGEDTSIKVWDLATGSLVKNLVGHTDHIYALAFNEHMNVLASGSMDGKVYLWNTEKEKSTSESSQLASFSTNSSCVMHLKFGSKNVLHAVTKQLK